MTRVPPGVQLVSFDVDGTLYDMERVRWRFLWRNKGRLRAVRVGRRVREELRSQSFVDGEAFLAAEAALAAERLHLDVAETRALLNDIFEASLVEILRRVGPGPGVRDALEALIRDGVRIAVASDRPARDKLRALGLDDLPWAAVVCADDTGALKPSRRVLETVAARVGVPTAAILHVGDRPDTDGGCAQAVSARFTVKEYGVDLSSALQSAGDPHLTGVEADEGRGPTSRSP